MDTFTLYIKNMVCPRCIESVKDLCKLEKLNVAHVELGKLSLRESPSAVDLEKLGGLLHDRGFELLQDKHQKLIGRIKTQIINLVHYSDDISEHVNISERLAKSLGQDYSYLSKLFSSVEGITIEKYAIMQKIERVKELLAYDELSLKEIAWEMGYSSVQHISGQFKKITGLTPTQFKQSQAVVRNSLDKI